MKFIIMQRFPVDMLLSENFSIIIHRRDAHEDFGNYY